MKLTATQHEHIAHGIRKTKEVINHAITVWYYGCDDESSFYSKRGLRFNRGKQIN